MLGVIREPKAVAVGGCTGCTERFNAIPHTDISSSSRSMHMGAENELVISTPLSDYLYRRNPLTELGLDCHLGYKPQAALQIPLRNEPTNAETVFLLLLKNGKPQTKLQKTSLNSAMFHFSHRNYN